MRRQSVEQFVRDPTKPSRARSKSMPQRRLGSRASSRPIRKIDPLSARRGSHPGYLSQLERLISWPPLGLLLDELQLSIGDRQLVALGICATVSARQERPTERARKAVESCFHHLLLLRPPVARTLLLPLT